jgi:quinol monooxygenase YgiN
MFFDLNFIGSPKRYHCESLNGFRYEGYGPKTKEGTSMELMIEIKAIPRKFRELDQTLQALLPTIRNEKGCRGCRIYRDAEDGETFFLSVEWEAQADLGRYMGSPFGLALLGAIDLLSERAGIKRGNDAPWEGIDTLKKMSKKQ